tara:strand:+ start:2515 stop:2724 length:210 start_codon:yes stop_codon:yes gene_type:complete
MNPKNKPQKPTLPKPSNENNSNSFSTVSGGSIEQFSDYILADGIWLKYLDGLALENQPYIAHYTSPEKP